MCKILNANFKKDNIFLINQEPLFRKRLFYTNAFLVFVKSSTRLVSDQQRLIANSVLRSEGYVLESSMIYFSLGHFAALPPNLFFLLFIKL